MNNVNMPTTERNYGVDLMKVLMTLSICILHIINYGGAQQGAYNNTATYIFLIAVKSVVVCSVNGFAMISGYVGIDSKYKFSRIIWLYVTVMVYNFIIPASIYYSYRDSAFIDISLDDKYVLKALFPVVFCTSWYFSAYFGLFFLIPFITSAVKNTDKKLALKLLGCLFFFICFFQHTVIILTEAPQYDSYGMNYGYSMMWLTLMYLAGAIVKKHDLFRNVNKWIFIVAFAVLSAIGVAVSLYMYHKNPVDKMNGPNDYNEDILLFTSPITVAQAFCLLLFFSRLKTAVPVQKILLFLIPHTFSIYIIHTQSYAWDYIIHDFYTEIGERTPITAGSLLLLNGLIIFTVCLIIDYPINKLINYLKLIISKIAQKCKSKTN